MACITLIVYCLLSWLQTIKEIFFIEQIPVAMIIVWIAVIILSTREKNDNMRFWKNGQSFEAMISKKDAGQYV
jgi:4-hydroxybenzoate polyprenyltransferase